MNSDPIIRSDSSREWYRDGKLYRLSFPTGRQYWYKPATKKLHRTDGPACIGIGDSSYYIDGEFQCIVLDRNILYVNKFRIIDLSQYRLLSILEENATYNRYVMDLEDVCLFLLAHPDTMVIQRDSETANHPDPLQEDSRTKPD